MKNIKNSYVVVFLVSILFALTNCTKQSMNNNTISTFNVRLGWGHNPVNNQCLNLQTGKTYSFIDASSISGSIDLIGYNYISTGACWFSPSRCDSTKNWSRRKGTEIGFSNVTKCTPSVFNNIKKTSDLISYTSYIDDVDGRTQSVEEGLVYPFKTFEGKQGLIHVVKIAGIDSDIQAYMDLEIKIEK